MLPCTSCQHPPISATLQCCTQKRIEIINWFNTRNTEGIMIFLLLGAFCTSLSLFSRSNCTARNICTCTSESAWNSYGLQFPQLQGNYSFFYPYLPHVLTEEDLITATLVKTLKLYDLAVLYEMIHFLSALLWLTSSRLTYDFL